MTLALPRLWPLVRTALLVLSLGLVGLVVPDSAVRPAELSPGPRTAQARAVLDRVLVRGTPALTAGRSAR